MKKTILIGDLHGNFQALPHLRKIYSDYDEIIVVGDMGVGFPGLQDTYLKRISSEIDEPPFIRFIRGNHDNPEVCKTFNDGGVQWIPDGTIEDGRLFIGGAWSIDYGFRTPGFDWWPDEELGDLEWNEVFKKLGGKYDDIHTVITHDAPYRVLHLVLGDRFIHKTKTSMYLDMLYNLLPNAKLWVFGHYHEYKDFRKGNTRFVCLPDRIERSLPI